MRIALIIPSLWMAGCLAAGRTSDQATGPTTTDLVTEIKAVAATVSSKVENSSQQVVNELWPWVVAQIGAGALSMVGGVVVALGILRVMRSAIAELGDE